LKFQKGQAMAPSKGKPVSGPGRLSQRTDLSLARNVSQNPTQGAKEIPSARYGEGKETSELQKAAPMRGNSVRVPNVPIAPLSGPSMRPEEPAEVGMPFGAGAGPESLALPPMQPVIPQELTTVAKYYDALENMARATEAPESFKLFVQAIRSQLGRQ
jgi:hypothetical protein